MRERLDQAFAEWARAAFRHSRLTLFVCFAFVGTLAFQILDLQIDPDAESPVQIRPALIPVDVNI